MTSPPDSGAAEQARRMVDAGEAAPAGRRGDEARALAWALKDLCYASWSSDPARAVRASEALQSLCAAGAQASPATPDREIAALADWTAGIACVTRGGMAEAIEGFDRAAAKFSELGQADPAAQTQVPKIMALSMLGRHAEAAACAAQAQQTFLALGDRRAAGRVSLNLGTLHWRRGDYALAARHSREAVLLFARVGDTEHSVMADIGLADALTALGDMDEALRIYARARMRAGSHGYPVLEAIALESVALLQLARGSYRDALAGLESARRCYEQLAMAQQQAVAEKQLADVYLELRLLPEALALFDRALAQFSTLNLPEEQAWTLTQRGRALALTAHAGQAAEAFESAAALFASHDNAIGASAVALARAQLALGNADPASALRLGRQAAAGFAAAGLVEQQARAEAFCARALLASGEIAQAQALFDATLQTARAARWLPVQVPCLTGSGLAAQAAGDAAAARAAFEAAAALFEEQRRVLPGDDLRSAFLADHLLPYQELLRMALDAQAKAPSADAAAGAWQQLERFRARVLGERLAQGARVDEPGASADLRARLDWLYRRVQRLQDAAEPAAALTEEVRRTERDLLERARRERLTQPAQASDSGIAAALNAASLCGQLGPDEALVEYGVLDDEVFACVLTRAGVQIVRGMARWSELRDGMASARFQIEALRTGVAPLQAHLERLTERVLVRLGRLHDMLWAPLAGTLASMRRVLIVPHAELGSLPFAALHDGRSCLGQRHQLAMAPSAQVAAHGLLRTASQPRRVLAMGESSRLPHAAREAQFVAAQFADGTALIDEEATLAALRRQARAADVLHFACHAQFRSDNPMFSALHLHDGALTVEAAETLDLSAGLVVLSACETALSEVSGGDETVGLVRAFLVAGAGRVLASLWPVDDATTARFMTHFYRALCQGAGPAAALQQAQHALRALQPHPFHWAAFALHGGW